MIFNIALFTESLWMLFGIPIGYSTPLTMTDESSKIQRGCQSDASVPRPTIIACVPLVLDRIQKKIKEKIEGEKRQSSIWPWSTRMNGLITDTTLPFLIRELIGFFFYRVGSIISIDRLILGPCSSRFEHSLGVASGSSCPAELLWHPKRRFSPISKRGACFSGHLHTVSALTVMSN
jgi:hypothetical protein